MKRIAISSVLFLSLALGSGLYAQSDLQSTDAKVRLKAVKQLADSGGSGAQKCEALAGLVAGHNGNSERVRALLATSLRDLAATLR